MSGWQESIDRGPGRLPDIRTTEQTITYEFSVVGGVTGRELFIPTKRTRLSIHCDRSGEITARILERRL